VLAERFELNAVVFDLDGVLVDTEAINLRAAFDAFAAVGRSLDASDAALIVGRHPVDYAPELMRRHGVPTDQYDDLVRNQGIRYEELWRRDARLTEGAVEALTVARAAGLRVGLATSSDRRGVEEALDRFDLRRFFDVTLSKDDVGARKPDPEIYRRAAERLGVPAAAMLVVEDSRHGIRAAKAAGAPCVAVRTPHTPEERLAEADVRIGSLLELAGLL